MGVEDPLDSFTGSSFLHIHWSDSSHMGLPNCKAGWEM